MSEEEDIDPTTLELVYNEGREAHGKLMSDIEALDSKADRLVQTNLVVVGILFGVASSDLSKDWTPLTWIPVFGVVSVFALSAIWAAWVGLPARFFSGTIFPHLLKERLAEPSEDVKADLVDVISRSYYHNNQAFLRRGRSVKIAGAMQLVAMAALVILVVIEVARLVA